ncbi:MAG: hypothetical protein KY432_09845, partial [Acidobacteria bacterium]|nr:hypothetical protein [Acidobacteriota bacterium]
MKRALIILVSLLMAVSILARQEPAEVTESSRSSMKSEVFEVRNQDPRAIASSVMLLGSGAAGAAAQRTGPSVHSPFTSRGVPVGLSSRRAGGSSACGVFWNATGRRNRRMAVAPTEVCSGLVVAGYGPPWCIAA